MTSPCLFVLTVLSLLLVSATSAKMTARHANPIRKVVTLLQDMQKTIEVDHEKAKALSDKFVCSCKQNEASLSKSLDDNTAKASEMASKVEQYTALKSQLEQELVEHKSDRAAAEKAVQESTQMREKEETSFSEASGEMKSNVEALAGALDALKKGVSQALMQTGTGQRIKDIVANAPSIEDETRAELMEFLQSDNAVSEGGSDQIVGVVSQMLEEMQGALKESESSEMQAKSDFKVLMSAKTKEIKAATRAIESKMQRAGELGVSIVQTKGEVKNTESSIDEDTKMKNSLIDTCTKKTQEFEVATKSSADEISAVSETIKVLNDDDSLELFKKSITSPAFLQTSTRSRLKMKRAAGVFDNMARTSPGHRAFYKLMQFQMKSAKSAGSGFEKVLVMIENMVELLKKEQSDDDTKKDWCIKEIDGGEDDLKALKLTIEDLSSETDQKADEVVAVASEIDGLKLGIAALDKSVAEATEQRKEEHTEFLTASAANQAAIDLLRLAKNKLNKFYNPKEYVAEEEDVALMQDSSRIHEANGVLVLLDTLTHDLELDIARMKKDEEANQQDYEEATAESAKKRQADSNTIVAKEESKAETSSVLDDRKALHSGKVSLLAANSEEHRDLHDSCDSLLSNFDARRKARTAELESLTTAQATLSGADFGFLQRHA